GRVNRCLDRKGMLVIHMPRCGHWLTPRFIQLPYAHVPSALAQQRRGHALKLHHRLHLLGVRQAREPLPAGLLRGEGAGDLGVQVVHCFHFVSKPWRWSTSVRYFKSSSACSRKMPTRSRSLSRPVCKQMATRCSARNTCVDVSS